MSIVELRYGDMFDGPSDLIVLPCSTSGSITELVREKLVLYNIPHPTVGMELGDLNIKPYNGGGNIAQYIAFAASVTEPNISSLHAIRKIGMLLGKETQRSRTIRRVAVPLLGAGAGGLQPVLVAGSLRDGFRSEAHEDSTLMISVRDRVIFELICSHAAVERVRQMTTAGAGSAPHELGALRRVLKPPTPPHPDQTFSPQPPRSPLTKHTILFLAANPIGTDRLVLDQEARAIHEELERSGYRDKFELVTRWAARPLDLLRELRKLKPTVVHFSGHGGRCEPSDARPNGGGAVVVGSGAGSHGRGLFFQGADGRPQLVSTAALEETLGAAGSSVKLIVLSACYSEVQSEALLAHVGCVVGMGGTIRDDAARNFAIGFYGGLGDCESVAAAYRQGCAAIGLEGLPDSDKPRLRVRDGVDAELVVLADLASVDPATRSRGMVSPPTPAYASAEVEALSKRLDHARARKQTLRDANLATDDVDREILQLRRELRDGGQLRAGDSLGEHRYLLVKPLGRGGFAVVWEAWDRAEQRRVAIKVLHQHLASDPQRQERFFRGARVMMELQHSAVVRVYDPRGEDEAFCYFVMELVPGGNLREAVLEQRVHRDDALPLILQIGEALALAHAGAMIHRDVKPANIVLDEHGNAKLTDFDLVGARDTTGGTRTGALGTVVYAAPECLDKPQEATARADVYGLGMTAVFCLAGKELSLSALRNPEPMLAELGCSDAIRNVLRRAVAWEPSERFADARVLVAELSRALVDPKDSLIDQLILDEMQKMTSQLDGDGAGLPQTTEGLMSLDPSVFVDTSNWAADMGPASLHHPPQHPAKPRSPRLPPRDLPAMPTPSPEIESLEQILEPERGRVHKWSDRSPLAHYAGRVLSAFRIRHPARHPWLLAMAIGATVLVAATALLSGSRDSAKDTEPFRSDVIRIGVITSLTGPQAAFGAAHKNGYTIAAHEINAKGGVLGKQVEVLYYDDQSKPDQGVQGVAKLVDQDHVAIILGAYSSETTRAIIPAVTQKGIPLIMPTATDDNVVATGSPWVFRVCAGANVYASAMVEFLKNNGTPKTIAIIYENTSIGQANAQSMAAAAPAAGMQIVDQEAYQASSPDYKALLHRVKAKNPEVVYFASYLLDATTLMRQSEQVDLSPKYITAAGTGFSAAEFPTERGAGKYAEYTFSVSQWLPSAKWAGSKEFDDAYFKLTGSRPAYHSMQAYAALLVAADAIKNANSDQPKAIADAIRKVHLDTPFGPIAFDAKGQNAHPVLISQVQGGQFKVVWPPDAAEAKPLSTPVWSAR